jgi:hypothetical protein
MDQQRSDEYQHEKFNELLKRKKNEEEAALDTLRETKQKLLDLLSRSSVLANLTPDGT